MALPGNEDRPAGGARVRRQVLGSLRVWCDGFEVDAGPRQQAYLLALLLVFHHKSPCGLRQVGAFLELAQLDHFVGSSYGALYALDLHLQDDLALFAKEQRAALALGMAAKDIVLCPDENFHGPHVCLVGIEPCSNFILVETYADRRDSATWAKAIQAGCDGLPVHVVALTSDCAGGLTRCAEAELLRAVVDGLGCPLPPLLLRG